MEPNCKKRAELNREMHIQLKIMLKDPVVPPISEFRSLTTLVKDVLEHTFWLIWHKCQKPTES